MKCAWAKPVPAGSKDRRELPGPNAHEDAEDREHAGREYIYIYIRLHVFCLPTGAKGFLLLLVM